jgi:hypothetical protein
MKQAWSFFFFCLHLTLCHHHYALAHPKAPAVDEPEEENEGLVKTILSPVLGSFNKLVEGFAAFARQDETGEGPLIGGALEKGTCGELGGAAESQRQCTKQTLTDPLSHSPLPFLLFYIYSSSV